MQNGSACLKGRVRSGGKLETSEYDNKYEQTYIVHSRQCNNVWCIWVFGSTVSNHDLFTLQNDKTDHSLIPKREFEANFLQQADETKACLLHSKYTGISVETHLNCENNDKDMSSLFSPHIILYIYIYVCVYGCTCVRAFVCVCMCVHACG